MKYYIYSDFFIDKINIDLSLLSNHKNDNCIIAGNMCSFENYEKFDYYLKSFSEKFKNVYIVNGLYEYDSNILTIEDCKNICIYFEKCYHNIKFLNDNYIIYDDVLIFGSTLWKENCKLNDKAKFFIQDALSTSIIKNYKIIIITNIPPSKTYCENLNNTSNYNIYNNLDYYFKYNKLFDIWIYGCTQENKNSIINNIHLISNQFLQSTQSVDLNMFIEL